VLGFKDSSGDPAFFSWLLSLKKERPYLKIFHGSEPAYGDLPDEELRNVDGLVSGNANLHPALLHEYTKNPRNAAVARGRSDLHTSIVGSSRSSHNNPVVSIEEHILQLKRKLVRLCVSPHDQQRKIFSHGQDVLLSHPRGSLFRTYRSNKA